MGRKRFVGLSLDSCGLETVVADNGVRNNVGELRVSEVIYMYILVNKQCSMVAGGSVCVVFVMQDHKRGNSGTSANRLSAARFAITRACNQTCSDQTFAEMQNKPAYTNT